MSTFTNFTAEEQLVYNKALSLQAGKSLWNTRPGFRYYIGTKGSNRWVDVETNFVTDGATIPRWLWWLLPPIDEYTQCTTLHDKLCTTYFIIELIDGVEHRVPVTRKVIDEILKESMDVMEVTPWKKKAIMFGVNVNRILKNPTEPKPVYSLAA
jgi:hypothetical protein